MSRDWIFLSKDGQDEYVNMLAKSCGAQITDTKDFEYEKSTAPIVLRGILKHKLMHRCWQDRRDFYYIDTGYFGNHVLKLYHRIVKNDLQHDAVIPRPADRWQSMSISLPTSRRQGRKIIIAAPDEKPCRFYGIDREQWIELVKTQIAQYTDRPVIVRERAKLRQDRVITDPLSKVLTEDVHALVTFNSNAAVESILLGVPAFVLAPTHAAAPVANRDLKDIEQPLWPIQDKLFAWACHLAYGQFHVKELRNGTALKIIQGQT
jgi:hypothetical protein